MLLENDNFLYEVVHIVYMHMRTCKYDCVAARMITAFWHLAYALRQIQDCMVTKYYSL